MHHPTRPRTRAALGVLALGTAAITLTGCFQSGPKAATYDGKDPSQIQAATIQLTGQGTFIAPDTLDPDEQAWAGSGFFITPGGLAVTNNHVVSGAGTLTANIGGDTTKSYKVTVLGASECYDLAVVKIGGLKGDASFLAWQKDPIQTGENVEALGFPLGDPTFSLTKGNVEKNDIPLSLNWAELSHAIQHTAGIRPGNSGGPLINEKGELVGVNFAGDDSSATSNYAIGRDDAMPIIGQLAQGDDVLSLGLNIQAQDPDDQYGITGIWVQGVKAGSPADKAGIKPGDVLQKLGGVSVGMDGTITDYCHVLDTQGTDSAISVEVYRPSTDEMLDGEVNGDAIQVTQENVYGGGDSSDNGDLPSGYTGVESDDSRLWVNQVPDTWTDTDTEANDNGNEVFYAAPDLDAFDNLEGSGLQFVGYSYGAYDVDTAAGAFTQLFDGLSSCSADPSTTGASQGDSYFTGKLWLYNCSGGSAFAILAFDLTDQSASGVIQVSLFPADSGDMDTTLQNIIDTFGLEGF